MKPIHPYILLVFLLVGACFRGVGQEEILTLKDGLAKVAVRYMVVADGFPGIQIDRLNNKTINPAVHKNPNIRIEVELLEVTMGYEVYISEASFQNDLEGFRRKGLYNSKLRNKGEKSRINYAYKPDVSGYNPIPLTLFIKRKGDDIIGSTNSSGQSYTLIRGGAVGSPTPVQPKAPSASDSETDFVELFEKLEATTDLSQQFVICQTFATAFNALPTQPSSETVNKITTQCREISIKKEWADTEARVNKMTKNHEQINAVNTFLRKYPNHTPAKQKLDALNEIRVQMGQGQKERAKAPKQNTQAGSIRENFRLEEIDRVEQGDVVIVTLEAKNHADRVVKLVPSVLIGIEKLGDSTFELAIPKGTVVEVTPIVEGVGEFGKIIFDLDILPVIAKYIWETGKKTLNIAIRDGIAPYRLHILNADGTVAETEKVEGSTHTLVLADYKRLPKGKYDLQIIDDQGTYRSPAGYKGIELGSMLGPVLMYLWLALALLGIGGIVYFYYKRSQGRIKLSDAERGDIEKLSGQAKENTSDASPTTNTQEDPKPTELTTQATEDRSGVRSSITIKKKGNNETAGTAAKSAGAPPPRPTVRGMKDAPLSPSFLIAPQNEYCNINLKDIWESSVVSNIYIRDIFVGRIHRFVFEENKGLMEARGEAMPEIGGWILGRQNQQSNGQYIVSFERFVQMHVHAGQSTTQLAFGPEAWHDIEKAKELYREEQLELVGWFHTHPGWGVFLSGEDLNVHKTFFTKPYQIAMELESVKTPREVGFFTRQADGGKLELNNRAASYHHWEDLYKWMVNG